jgi:hypothetical protein
VGHANLSNLSNFFINRLYAKGSLSISECIEALQAAGETLHASEGEYDEDSMLAMGLIDIVHYLTLVGPSKHGYSGPESGGLDRTGSGRVARAEEGGQCRDSPIARGVRGTVAGFCALLDCRRQAR